MHELGIALEICRIVEEHVPADMRADVGEVVIEVGDAAGIEPANLEFCLEALLSRPPFGRAFPRLELVGGDVLRVDSFEVDDGDSNDTGPRTGHGAQRRDRGGGPRTPENERRRRAEPDLVPGVG